MGPHEMNGFLGDLLGHLDSLYNFARWLTRDPDEAEDLVHDALSRVLATEKGYPSGTNAKAYLFTVIKRMYINRVRRRRYEVTSFGYPEEDTLPPDVGPREFTRLPLECVRKDLNQALEELPAGQRSVVLLADVEGFSLEEISQVMGIPVGTVKSKLWRARDALRKKLESYQETVGP